jgi:outer membrane protein TolC
MITLSTVQTTFFQYEFNLTLARLAYYQSAASLYQALGGGWSRRRATPKSPALTRRMKPIRGLDHKFMASR